MLNAAFTIATHIGGPRLRTIRPAFAISQGEQWWAALFQIFTIAVDGKPIAAFNAPSAEDARGICDLAEFRSDLAELTSAGIALCGALSSITVRSATNEEKAAFASGAGTPLDIDVTTFVFLVDIDCIAGSMHNVGYDDDTTGPLRL